MAKDGELKILQQEILNENDSFTYYVVLIEFRDDQIESIYKVRYPKDYKYYNEQFKFYNIVFN